MASGGDPKAPTGGRCCACTAPAATSASTPLTILALMDDMPRQSARFIAPIIHPGEQRCKINLGGYTAILSINRVEPSLAATRMRKGPSLREVTGAKVAAWRTSK